MSRSKKNIKWALSLLLWTAVSSSFLTLPMGAVAAAKPTGNFDGSDVPCQPVITNNHDGAGMLEKLAERVKQIGAYKFDGNLCTVKEKELAVDSGSFYYKSPSRLRVEVKNGGYKSGSILVKQPDGQIKAKGGMALLGMKVTLEPDSHMLILPNGFKITECDFLSLVQGVKAQISSGHKVYCSENPLKLDSQNNSVLVLETRDPSSELRQRILLDPQQFVPVEWDFFKNGKFFSTVRFKNFQVCPAIDESMFRL